MPQHQIKYSILLSSPSDVPDERALVASVIAELNQTWGYPNSAVISLLSWELSVAPGFGTEGQDVVNRDLGDNWDIYLGLMHARFGTPTKAFGSGTEEEFEHAFNLWTKEPDRRELMFYFKTAPLAIDVDTSQLEKVRAFQAKIRSGGGLHGDFLNIDEFAPLLRIHLSKRLTALHGKTHSASLSPRAKPQMANLELVPTESDEPGFLDAMEVAMRELGALPEIITAIGSLANDSTAFIGSSSKELQSAMSLGDLTGMRKTITALARHMSGMAEKMADSRRAYASSSTQAFQSFAIAVSIVRQHGGAKTETEALRDKIGYAMEMLRGFHSSTTELERIIAGLPNFATDFNRARLSLKTEVRYLADEVGRSLDLIEKLLLAFDE